MLTRSRVKAAPKRKPPPSPAHHAEPSDSEVEVLDEVPRHLQKRNNAKRPIAVLDSDDEAEEIQFGEADRHLWAGLTEADLEMMETDAREKSRSRSHSGSEELLGSPPSPKEPKVGPSRLNKAGPSSPLEAGPANPTKRARFQEASPAPEAPALSESQRLLPKLLDILPDICPTFALQKLETLLNSEHKDSFVERLVDYALELPGGYPKAGAVDKTEKGKGGVVVSIEDKEMYRNIRYRINERMGRGYLRNSLIALEEYFEYMPSLHIRTEFFSQSSLYTPTFLVLQQQSQEEHKPYAQLKMPRGARKGKGKVVLVEPGSSADDAGDGGIGEFEAEKHWLLNVLAEENVAKEHAESKRIAHDEAIANGGGIECGCCFGEEIWEEMFQCSEGHLFCRECTTTHTETKLGDQQCLILCMDVSGCVAQFPESELKRLLTNKSLNLFHRLQQDFAIGQARIDGLESCPECPYAAIIEDEHEKLFRCMNEKCGAVSCRKCRRKEHIPKTCEEMEQDRKLDKRHAVEEAMSEAAVRKCPTCQKAYIKDSGCNKIYCNGCRTISCYICRKAIPEGYSHFDQTPANYAQKKDASKCPLWDSNEKQTEAANIVAAGDAAAVRVRAAAAAEGIELGDNDLAVPPPSGLDKIPLGAPTGAEAAAAVDAWFLGVDLRQRMLNNQLEAANLQAGLRVAQARALPVHLANAHPAHPAARDPIPAAEPRMVAPLPRRAGEPPQALDRQLRRKNAQIG